MKVDRSFVNNIRSDARRFNLLRGVVQLARELGLKVIVEGVETEDQLELIRLHHCADLVQGYIFARPMPAAEILDLVFVTDRKRGMAPETALPPDLRDNPAAPRDGCSSTGLPARSTVLGIAPARAINRLTKG